MRALAVIPFIILAASCGETPAENKAQPAAALPPAGQWELTSEVTSLAKVDTEAPRLNTPVGTRATNSVCAAEGHQLPSAFFAGEGYRCTYGTYYARNGRLNVTMSCRRDGLAGDITMAAEGTYQGDTAEFRRNLRTNLTTEGDSVIDARVTARRTGDCTPQAAGAEGQNAQ
ncbi:MAG TPA: DUF3617 family protein [Allosphingosinicella sp.]|nr:DUF3617 family protein [Allosphingosinicella sp.]